MASVGTRRDEGELFSPDLIVQADDIVARPRGYSATGFSPSFTIKPERPIPPGWYEFLLRADFADTAEPKLHFQFDRGLDQRPRLWWDGTTYSAVVHADRAITALRLAPCDRPMDFSVASLRMRRLAFHESASWRTRRLAAWTRRRLRGVSRASFSSVLERLVLGRFEAGRRTAPPRGARARYHAWIARFDYSPAKHRAAIAAVVAALHDKPTISVLMPVTNTQKRLLEEAIASVVGQIYPRWELRIGVDCSADEHVRAIVANWTAKDPRIKAVFRTEDGHVAAAMNTALALAGGAWIARLDADDVLREHALAEVAIAINSRPDAELIYSDEDRIDADGERHDPHFKPDFSPEYFRSINYLDRLTVHRAVNIRSVGGWRTGFEGSEDHDLNLRIFETIPANRIVHISKILCHRRAAAGSSEAVGIGEDAASRAAERTLREHAVRAKLDAEVLAVPGTPYYRLRYAVGDPPPLVSIIIATRDHLDLLSTAVSSIVERTRYPNTEIIIVDNASRDAAALAYLESLSTKPGFRVLRHPHVFNYSAINNEAARHANGEILALLNNDIEVIEPEWLTEMVSLARQPPIGCVGAKLYYPDDTIQHAGVILGLGGVAGHAHRHVKRDASGYFHRLRVPQDVSAVTAACLVVRKSVYFEVGGLDEEKLAVAFNDVDFCLKVREAGYRNIWTPFAELYHHESKSRGPERKGPDRERLLAEAKVMRERWLQALMTDPFYSIHLTHDTEDFAIAD